MPSHLTGLTLKGRVWWIRFRIPADISATYPKREELENLETRDRAVAERRYPDGLKAIQARLDQHRASIVGAPKPPVTTMPTDHHAACAARYAELVKAQPLRRRALLQRARDDEAAFWRGEIIPLPDDNVDDADYDLRPDFWRDRIAAAEGTLETAFLYLVDREQRKRLALLQNRHSIGDCDEFLNLARKLDPSSKGAPLDSFAFDLMLSEIHALQDIAAKDQTRLARLTRPPISATEAVPVAAPKDNPLLSVARVEWLKEKVHGSDLTAGHLGASQEAIDLFIEIVGDKPIASYRKSDARDYKALVSTLPPNRRKTKALRGLSARAAAAEASRLKLPPMGVETINKRLAILSSVFKWLQQNYDAVTINPFDGATIAEKANARDGKNPFTLVDLTAIFAAPIYTGCASARDWSTPGTFGMRDKAVFWLPLLGLYTGARANELCKLKVTDVRQEGDIWYLDINEEAHSNPKIRPNVKTPSSVRRIPLHPDLIAFRFLDHVDAQRTNRAELLFSELKPNAIGKMQDGFGKHFRRFLISVGVKRAKIDFHSFRHTWVDACANSGIADGTTLRLKGDALPGTLNRYGNGKADLELLAAGMELLDFKGLDLDHIKKRSE